MPINNNIIIRLIFSFLFFAITLRVLLPLFFDFIKKKLPGNSSSDVDIDQMIRRQQERLRAQNGIPSKSTNNSTSKEIQKIFQETKWGGGAISKEIQQYIALNFSYSMTETKVNSFIFLCEKRRYFDFLNSTHRDSDQSIKNYLTVLLILFLLSEDLREKKLELTEKVAKKLMLPPNEVALALQMKLLLNHPQKNDLKENRLYSENLDISQYSEETMRMAIEKIAQSEANSWAKGTSHFFEELSLVLNYAHLILPLPLLKNKNDLSGAYAILKANPNQSTESLKSHYKKLAMKRHPDKIVSQKLPTRIESIAVSRWKNIQEAYDIIMSSRK